MDVTWISRFEFEDGMLERFTQYLSARLTKSAQNGSFLLQPLHIGESDTALTPADYVPISHPSPVFSELSVAFVSGSLRAGPDRLQILGDLAVTGRVDDRASGLLPDDIGLIQAVTVMLNGSTVPLATINLEVSKETDHHSITRPFPFRAQFSKVIRGAVLQPGWNLLTFFVTNRHGISGFAELSIEVRGTGPADPTVRDYAQFRFEQGEVEEGSCTCGGDLSPFLLCVKRIAESAGEVSQVILNDREYATVAYQGHRCLARPGSATPLVFLAIFAPRSENAPVCRLRPGAWDFSDGFGAGLVRFSMHIFDREAVVGPAHWHASAEAVAVPVSYRVRGTNAPNLTGLQSFSAQWPTASRLAAIMETILKDEDPTVTEILTKSCMEINRLSAECAEAFADLLELMQMTAEEAPDYSKAELGRLLGQLLNEALRCLGRRGVATALKSDILKDCHAQYLADPHSFD